MAAWRPDNQGFDAPRRLERTTLQACAAKHVHRTSHLPWRRARRARCGAFLATFLHPMTTDLKQLLAARAALEAQIAQARTVESKAALAQIHAWIEDFGFTAQQVFPWKAPATQKVAAKYLDEKTGATWTGRGKPPAWIQGKNRDDFLIDKPRQEPQSQEPLLAEMAAAAYRNQRR